MALGTHGPREPRGKLCYTMILPHVTSVALTTCSWAEQGDLEVQETRYIFQHQRQKKPSSFDFTEAYSLSKTYLEVCPGEGPMRQWGSKEKPWLTVSILYLLSIVTYFKYTLQYNKLKHYTHATQPPF